MADGPEPSRSLLNALDAVVSTAMALTLAVVLATVLLQVLFRYVFSHPLAWTQELAQYAFIWMVYLGGGLGVRRGVHLRVSLIEHWFPPRLRRMLPLLSTAVSMILAMVFLIVGGIMVWRTWPHRSPAMGLPMGSIYLIFPISGVVLALCLVEEACRGVAGRPDCAEPGEGH